MSFLCWTYRVAVACAAIAVCSVSSIAQVASHIETSNPKPLSTTTLNWGAARAETSAPPVNGVQTVKRHPLSNSRSFATTNASWETKVQSMVPEWLVSSEREFNGYGNTQQTAYEEPASRSLFSDNNAQPAAEPKLLQNSLFNAQPIRSASNDRIFTGRESSDKRSTWRGTLIPNLDRSPGSPPYIVVDSYSKKRRYVRPGQNSDLERFINRHVIVRDDTGLVLEESQLDLPISELRKPQRRAIHDRRVTQAGFREDTMGLAPPHVETEGSAVPETRRATRTRPRRLAQREGDIIYEGTAGAEGGEYYANEGLPEGYYGDGDW